MEQRLDRLYPSAPLKTNDLEQQLEKKLNGVNSFNIHMNNIKKVVTYFKDNNHESKTEVWDVSNVNYIIKLVWYIF